MTHVLATAGYAVPVGRNDPCPCGAGMKAKRCHLAPGGPPAGAVAIIGGASPALRGVKSWNRDRTSEPLLAFLDAGAGDAIHAMRHVARVEALAPTTWVLRPDMVRLFRASFPDSRVVTSYPLPSAVWRTGSLQLLDWCSEEPAATYLRAPNPQPPRGGLSVGLCLRGDRTQAFDRWRSIHAAAVIAPLLSLPGIAWHQLDKGPFGDWADTADLVASLDLVISVDTGVAHLAGALGRPLWLLNRAPGPGDPGPDDRWCSDFLQPGPLYPDVRVFQQERRGDWSDVVSAVCEELRNF